METQDWDDPVRVIHDDVDAGVRSEARAIKAGNGSSITFELCDEQTKNGMKSVSSTHSCTLIVVRPRHISEAEARSIWRRNRKSQLHRLGTYTLSPDRTLQS